MTGPEDVDACLACEGDGCDQCDGTGDAPATSRPDYRLGRTSDNPRLCGYCGYAEGHTVLGAARPEASQRAAQAPPE